MNSSPRRYCVNSEGHRVLIGLTLQETIEFEALDKLPALAEEGDTAALQEDELKGRGHEQRRFDLYAKHQSAWRQWMADKKDGHLDWLVRLGIDG